MSLKVRIETVVLDGLPLSPGQAIAIRVALQAELTRLLTARPVAADSLARSAPVASGRPAPIGPADGPARIGRAVARSVEGGMRR